MIFDGIMKSEALFFHPDNDKDNLHFVEMERDCEEGTFRVSVCCDDGLEWRFKDEASNYELVKHAIFDVAFDSENMTELINNLDEVFEEYFYEIAAYECNRCCGNCNCK
jgi:hypothetical protein